MAPRKAVPWTLSLFIHSVNFCRGSSESSDDALMPCICVRRTHAYVQTDTYKMELVHRNSLISGMDHPVLDAESADSALMVALLPRIDILTSNGPEALAFPGASDLAGAGLKLKGHLPAETLLVVRDGPNG